MKSSKEILKVLSAIIVLCFILSGCSLVYLITLSDAAPVPRGYKNRVIERYNAYDSEGFLYGHSYYYLVKTVKGQAICEIRVDGSEVFSQKHWIDDQGDHFAGWRAFNKGTNLLFLLIEVRKAKTLGRKGSKDRSSGFLRKPL